MKNEARGQLGDLLAGLVVSDHVSADDAAQLLAAVDDGVAPAERILEDLEKLFGVALHIADGTVSRDEGTILVRGLAEATLSKAGSS